MRPVAQVPDAPGGPGSARFSQHPHKDRPQVRVLLGVDQELSERPRLGVPILLADPTGSLEVGSIRTVPV